jgi:hypothetical protein
MTMPHLMNCGHSEDGWCLMCVHELNARLEMTNEQAVRLAEDLTRLKAKKCTCDDSTGWTKIRCCNLCGMTHKSETMSWHINLRNDNE